jgi:ketosteroid isomerase-like protein
MSYRLPRLIIGMLLSIALDEAVTASGSAIAPDKMKSVRAALEEQYAKQRQAYFDKNPDAIQAVRAPDFAVQPPKGPRQTSEDAAAYLKTSFEQVKQTLRLSFDIQSLIVQGDTAIVTIHQHWKREQNKGGRVRTVETEAMQREWWRSTPQGWQIFFIDDIHPGVWKVDGKRIDPTKPYDPAAPPYEPDRAVKNGPG